MDNNNNNKPVNKARHFIKVPKFVANEPKHRLDVWHIFNGNAEIRRYVSVIIINNLKQRNVIKKEDKAFVKFYPKKFTVEVNGLGTDYAYSETFFANAFSAAFICFTADAQKKLNILLKTEYGFTLDKAVDEDTVKEIVETGVNPTEEVSE